MNLSEFGSVRTYKGWRPVRIPDIGGRTFAFVRIDADLYQPTLDSMAFFYPRMSAGGIVLCDDYGCSSRPGAAQAIDQFCDDERSRR